MTVGEWLQARDPRPPTGLDTRLREVLGVSVERDASDACELMLAASQQLVARMLANGSTTRDSALDLLVADSLVTYAFEAASTTAQIIEPSSRRAMREIAALAERIV